MTEQCQQGPGVKPTRCDYEGLLVTKVIVNVCVRSTK